jgi:hypothetical protein
MPLEETVPPATRAGVGEIGALEEAIESLTGSYREFKGTRGLVRRCFSSEFAVCSS